MTETARLRLPEIAAAQAQKHVTHNEALMMLDTLVQASVLDKDLTAPPSTPEEGDCYIVAGAGGTASGAWTSWETRIARFQDGQWRSFLPGAGSGAGWLVWVTDEDAMYRFDGTAWSLAGIEGPEGPPGADGQSFTVDATGLLAARDDYDDEPQGFAFLATDTGDLYIKASAGTGDWSDPIGFVGPQGDQGPPGADGTNPGLRWRFDVATTMADPGAGDLRLNHATPASVTAIALSASCAESGDPDVSDFVATWDDSTNTVKGHLLLKTVSTPQNFRIYAISAVADNTDWLQLTVAPVAGSGSFSAGDLLSLEFLRAGDAGAGGAPADLDIVLAELALGLADALNVAQFLGASGNRVADSFDATTYVDTGGSTNLNTGVAGLLKPTSSGGGTGSSATPGVSGGGFNFSTFVERGFSLTNGSTVQSLGFYSTAAGSLTMKIVKRNSAGVYDVVVSQSISHGGGGWQDFTLSSPYTVPGGGTYHVAAYIGITGNVIHYNASVARAFKSGDITGTGQSGFTEDTNAMCALRATYQGTTNNMTALSAAFTAAAAPASMKVVARVKFIDAVTLGTDLTVEVSRDGGTSWTTATMNDRFTANTLHVLDSNAIDVSGQPSGTSVKWRVKSLNNKALELHDLYVYWS